MKHKEHNRKELSLFFSFNVSLEQWHSQGLLGREKLLYERHLESGTFETIHWFTYGRDDRALAKTLHTNGTLDTRIIIHPLPRFFNTFIGKGVYSLLLPFIHWNTLRASQILKTNQFSGSWTGIIASLITRRPVILRSGYIWSQFAKKQHKNILKRAAIYCIEKISIAMSTICVVANDSDKLYLQKRYNLSPEKITVIPNYIDTSLFKPLNQQRAASLVFVGRLSEQKNVFNLIDACATANINLDIYGSGPLENELKKKATDIQAPVTFKGVVDNRDLPAILNTYTFYILPSLYEGTPKTLLEAMACGCVCIGTDTYGIRDIIDGTNGILIKGTRSTDIEQVLGKLSNIDRASLSSNAVKTITDNFSLNAVLEKERNVFENLLRS